MLLAVLPALPRVADAATAPRASDGLVSAEDLPGATARSVSAKGWATLLPARSRRGAKAATRTLRASGDPPWSLVTRALLAASVARAKGLERAARRLSARRLGSLDAAALGARPSTLGRPLRITWREGRVVGQVTWVDPTGRWGNAIPRGVVRALRARVRAIRPATAWDALERRVARRGGRVDPTTAMQAFTLAFGALPGVRRPRGPAGRPSASTALEWVAAAGRRLSARRRAQIARVLARLQRGSRLPPGARAAGGQFAADQRIAAEATDFYRRKMGLTNRYVPAYVGYVARAVTKGLGVSDGFEALTLVRPLFGVAPPQVCNLLLLPTGQSYTGAARRYVIAHEAFHCIIAQVAYDRARSSGLGLRGWLNEGTPTWAGCNFAPGVTYGGGPVGHHGNWARTADEPAWSGSEQIHPDLLSRRYDAVGFFLLLQNTGLDPWPRMKAILQDGLGTGRGGYEAATRGGEDTLLDVWAATYFRDSGRGGDWEMAGPCAPPRAARVEPEIVPIANGSGDILTARPFTVRARELESRADLVHVQTRIGHLRVQGNGVDDRHVRDTWYCTDTNRCACPPGRHYAGPAFTMLPRSGPRPALALTGGPSGLRATLRGVKKDCRPGNPPPPPPSTTCPTLKAHQVCFVFDGALTTTLQSAAWKGSGSWKVKLVWLVTWPTWYEEDRYVDSLSSGSGQVDVSVSDPRIGPTADCHTAPSLKPQDTVGQLLTANGPAGTSWNVLNPLIRAIGAKCPPDTTNATGFAWVLCDAVPDQSFDFPLNLNAGGTQSRSYGATRACPTGGLYTGGSYTWNGTVTATVGPGPYT